MKRFVEGTDRGQITLFPAVLDDYVGEDMPARIARRLGRRKAAGLGRAVQAHRSDVISKGHTPNTQRPF
jgi:hypothetical protein